jgi:NAD kinase
VSGLPPRAVVVTRKSEYQLLLERHATAAQARFFLLARGESIDEVVERHERFVAARAAVLAAVPLRWRRAQIDRDDLARFLFEPEDVLVVVGQDGLVANVAKYLAGQRVIGINPDPALFDGVLVPHRPEHAAELLLAAAAGRAEVELRTMVAVHLDDGQELCALNEVFVGHRTHQSARYEIAVADRYELQSSSGVVVASGTGATGWARSIHRERHTSVVLPEPAEARLAFFVREAFPSRATSVSLTNGSLGPGDELRLVSRMNVDGVVFGDGIEGDRLAFGWGVHARVGMADRCLELVRSI